jgi:hypothetical protein
MFSKRRNQKNIAQKNYALHFKNLKDLNILVRKRNMFVIMHILLHDVIIHGCLKDLCDKTK